MARAIICDKCGKASACTNNVRALIYRLNRHGDVINDCNNKVCLDLCDECYTKFMEEITHE